MSSVSRFISGVSNSSGGAEDIPEPSTIIPSEFDTPSGRKRIDMKFWDIPVEPPEERQPPRILGIPETVEERNKRLLVPIEYDPNSPSDAFLVKEERTRQALVKALGLGAKDKIPDTNKS